MPTRSSGVSRVAWPACGSSSSSGSIGTIGGIYYSFVTPWIDVPTGTWMTWVGGISLGMFALGLVVYIFGRRSAHKTSKEDSLAHLAVFDLNKNEADGVSQMTMDSTMLSTPDTGDSARYPLDPLDRGGDRGGRRGSSSGSEYATPTLKFVMIQLAEPAKTAELTFDPALEVPRRAFVTMYDAAAKLIYEAVVDLGGRA